MFLKNSEVNPEVITSTSSRAHKKACPVRTVQQNIHPESFISEKNSFQCSSCPLVFDFRSQLLVHELSHKETNPCEFCGKAIFKDNIQAHMDLCKSLSICDFCGFTASRNELNKHLELHVKSQKVKKRKHKPFCDVCKREYKDIELLKAHNESVHESTLDYKCRICKNLFISLALVRQHIKTVHAGCSLTYYKYIGKLAEDSGFEAAGAKWQKNKIHKRNKEKSAASVKITTKLSTDPIFDVATEKLFEIKLNHSQSNDKPTQNISDNQAEKMVKIVSASNETKDFNSKHMQTIYKDGKTFIDPAEFVKEVIKNDTMNIPNEGVVVKEEDIEEYRITTVAPNIFIAADNNKCQFNTQKFVCSFCPTSFSHESALLTHQAQHNIRKPTTFECDLCNSIFGEKFALEVHMNVIHCNTKFYSCHQCTFVTRQLYLLKHHQQNHKRKCTKCSICKKEFYKRELLQDHNKRAHEHTCEVCGKMFKSQTYAKRHFKTAHSGEKKFKCNFCHSLFASRSAINQHVGSLWKIGKCSSIL